MDDALNDREGDAVAFELALAVHPLKRAEQVARVAHVEAHSVVANEQRGAARPDLDDRRIGLGRVLPRIAQQVVEHDPEQERIGVRDETVGDPDFDLTRFVVVTKDLDDLAREP